MVADPVADTGIGWGRNLSRQSLVSQQFIDRSRIPATQIFSFWVSPKILGRARYVDWAGSDARDDRVLIERHRCFILIVVSKLVAEPMRERSIDSNHRFAKIAAF